MTDTSPASGGRSRILLTIAGLAALTALYAFVITGFVHSGGAQRKTFAPVGDAPNS